MSTDELKSDCPICGDAPGHHWLWRDERLRIIERSVILPGSQINWQFAVAASRGELDAQIRRIRADGVTVLARAWCEAQAALPDLARRLTKFCSHIQDRAG